MLRIAPMVVVLLVAVLVVGCGDDDGGAPTVTASPSASATATASAVRTAGPTLPPISEKVEVAGVTLYPADEWYASGRSGCASLNPEAPYLGPTVFSIRDEELPELEFPGHEVLGVRVCKHAGVTALGYIFNDGIVDVVAGAAEWPLRAAEEQISAGEIGGRQAVFVEPPTEMHIRGAQVLFATEFGLIVVALDGTLDDAKAVAAAIGPDAITVPVGKPSFEGMLNGIRFYNELNGPNRADGCEWGSYGLQDPDAVQIAIPEGSPLDAQPSYLPEGYADDYKQGWDCGSGDVEFVEAQYGSDLGVYRLSGEAAWQTYYSEDWLATGEIAGLPAVLIEPPWENESDTLSQVVVKESFGITVVYGPSLEEARLVAEGLNR